MYITWAKSSWCFVNWDVLNKAVARIRHIVLKFKIVKKQF